MDWGTTGLDYSTTETALPFKWVDGKTIYRKVVNFGSLPNNTTKTVSLGISGTIDNVISASAIASTGSGTVATFVYSVSSQPGNIRFTVQKVDKTVSIVTQTDRSEFNWCYVFIEYTKN